VRYDCRAGLDAARWSAGVTRTLAGRAWVTIAGSAGRASGVVSRGEVALEYGRGLTFDSRRPVRGVEVTLHARRLWFDAADVVTLTPGALFYLPRDWTVSVSVTAARSRFPELGTAWRPASLTRLNAPIGARVVGQVFVASGTENFALADQIGRFSARTVGAGVRIQVADGKDVLGYVARQARTQGRTQTSAGMGYVLRF